MPRQDETQELLGPSLIHELRQPLLGVKAGLELLARRLGPEITKLDDWGLVAGQVARLEELCTGYQTLFHPERAVPFAFDLAPVVRRSVELLRFRLSRLGDRMQVSLPSNLPPALGVPNALTHTVTNLVVNALESLDPMSSTARIQLRVLPGKQGTLEIRVSDEGAGIPEELAEKVFEPRFTTKATGSGLGLYVCRRMMEAIGGEVFIVPAKDPNRQPWAATEVCVVVKTQ